MLRLASKEIKIARICFINKIKVFLFASFSYKVALTCIINPLNIQ